VSPSERPEGTRRAAPGRKRQESAAFAGAALLVGSQALFGFPQALWWTLLTGLAFVLWRARQPQGIRWTRTIAPAGAAIAGLLIGGVQILPTLAAAAHSSRAHESHSFLLSYSLHPWNMVQLWSPYALKFRSFSRLDRLSFTSSRCIRRRFSCSRLSGCGSGARRSGGAAGFAAACGVFAAVLFVLALGRYGKLASLVLYLPGVGSLRAPARYIVLMQLALATLADIAIEDLAGLRSQGVRLSRREIAAIASVAVLNVLTLLLFNTGVMPVAPDVIPADVLHAAPGTAIVIGATVLLLLAARGIPWAVPALIVFTAVDLSCWGLTYIYRTPPVPLSSFSIRMPDNPGPGPMRLSGPSNWSDMPIMNGYQLVGGYAGLYPKTALPWEEDSFRRLAGAARRFDKTLTVVDLTDGVPRARMLTDARVSRDPAADIREIDLLKTALVGDPIAPLDSAPGAAAMLTDRPGHLIVQTDAAGGEITPVC
jgi:hypothetical protein